MVIISDIMTAATECFVRRPDSSYYIEHFAYVDFTEFRSRFHCVMVSLTSLAGRAGQYRVVHGSSLSDPIQPNPSAD